MKRYILALGMTIAMGAMVANASENGVNDTNATAVTESAEVLQARLDSIENANYIKDRNQRIWKRHKFTRIGYAWAQNAAENADVEKGQFGVFYQQGNTYFFPKTPLWGHVKIGIDAIWADVQFSKYKSVSESGEWTSDFEIPTYPGYGDNNDDDYDFDMNFGRMGLSVGVGVGPNISVAPFATSRLKNLQALRAGVYFHYSPTMQMYFVSQDGDMEMSTAFANMFDFGGYIQWKALSVGIEGRWGQCKMKPLDFGELLGEESMGADKYTRKFANTRLYLGLVF